MAQNQYCQKISTVKISVAHKSALKEKNQHLAEICDVHFNYVYFITHSRYA